MTRCIGRAIAALTALTLALCGSALCAGELYAYYADAGCVLIDAQGEIHSSAFDSIIALTSSAGRRRFIARVNGPDGERAMLLDEQGEELLDRWRDDIYSSGGMLVFESGGLLGALDWQGNEVLPPRYTIMAPTGEGGYLTSTDNTADGIADEIYFTEPDGSSRYLNISASYIGEFSGGLVRARSRDGKYGYLSAQGLWAIAPIYDEADDFMGGKAVVWRGGRAGLIDESGRAILPARYDSIIISSGGRAAQLTVAIRAGMATVYGADMLPALTMEGVMYAYLPEPELAVLVREDGSTLCDGRGRELLSAASNEFIEALGGECALITGPDGAALASPEGRTPLEGALEAHALRDGGEPYAICAFDGAHYGAFDLEGNALLKYEYDSMAPLCAGVFAVSQGARHGLVDERGDWLYVQRGAGALVD